ncbi:MAG: hypothetical protein R2708_01195 [Vicinamibacterales bacterium]
MTRPAGRGPEDCTICSSVIPGRVLHHVIEGAVVGEAVVEDLHRVPVLQPGGGADLALETRQRLGITGAVGPDEFDRHGLLQEQVLCQVHFAHAAAAEAPYELVLAESARLGHLLPQFGEFGRAEHGDDGRQQQPEGHERDDASGVRPVDRIPDCHRRRDRQRQRGLRGHDRAASPECLGNDRGQRHDSKGPADGHRLGGQADGVGIGDAVRREADALERVGLRPADVHGQRGNQAVLDEPQPFERPPSGPPPQDQRGHRGEDADRGFGHEQHHAVARRQEERALGRLHVAEQREERGGRHEEDREHEQATPQERRQLAGRGWRSRCHRREPSPRGRGSRPRRPGRREHSVTRAASARDREGAGRHGASGHRIAP